jgi:hypothetical protein
MQEARLQTHTRTQEPPEALIPAMLRHPVTRQTTDAGLPGDWTVDRATREIARAIELPKRNAENAEQEYELFVRRADGRSERLRPSALLRDTVQPGDEIEPMPEVVPGRGR